MQINICMKRIVLITGGFDPLHSGHIAYFKAAKKLGDLLIVGVNSDEWLARKKGTAFMPYRERAEIVKNIVGVDFVIDFDDRDGSARHAIQMVRQSYPGNPIIFANGGDRTQENIPEMSVEDPKLEFVFGVGGEDKKNSSSWILQEWKAPKTERAWGYYRVLHETPGMKVKELTVNPGQSLSMQRHWLRSEYWIVNEGAAIVNSITEGGYVLPPKYLHKHAEYHVPSLGWHQLTNPYEMPLKVVEIQYGEQCVEEDIERK
jgi:cytidyltransferase-like protein